MKSILRTHSISDLIYFIQPDPQTGERVITVCVKVDKSSTTESILVLPIRGSKLKKFEHLPVAEAKRLMYNFQSGGTLVRQYMGDPDPTVIPKTASYKNLDGITEVRMSDSATVGAMEKLKINSSEYFGTTTPTSENQYLNIYFPYSSAGVFGFRYIMEDSHITPLLFQTIASPTTRTLVFLPPQHPEVFRQGLLDSIEKQGWVKKPPPAASFDILADETEFTKGAAKLLVGVLILPVVRASFLGFYGSDLDEPMTLYI